MGFQLDADFAEALYVNLFGIQDPAAIMHDMRQFKQSLKLMQREILETIDYALYISEETYNGYFQAFHKNFKEKRRMKLGGSTLSSISTASVEEEKKGPIPSKLPGKEGGG